MRRLNAREVELNPKEARCHDDYERFLDEGWGCTAAADKAIKAHPEVSRTFQEWLRGDRVAG